MTKNVLKVEEYTRSLPNSRWLRDILEYKKEIYEIILADKGWQQRQRKSGRKLDRIEFKTSPRFLNNVSE